MRATWLALLALTACHQAPRHAPTAPAGAASPVPVAAGFAAVRGYGVLVWGMDGGAGQQALAQAQIRFQLVRGATGGFPASGSGRGLAEVSFDQLRFADGPWAVVGHLVGFVLDDITLTRAVPGASQAEAALAELEQRYGKSPYREAGQGGVSVVGRWVNAAGELTLTRVPAGRGFTLIERYQRLPSTRP